MPGGLFHNKVYIFLKRVGTVAAINPGLASLTVVWRLQIISACAVLGSHFCKKIGSNFILTWILKQVHWSGEHTGQRFPSN